MARTKSIYKIIFHNRGKIYEIHAKQVQHSALLGFVEVEGLIFGDKSAVLVDPCEEKLQAEFSGVKRTYIPIQAVLRIDEVDKQGTNKISPAGENVTPFPSPIFTPGRDQT